ncbi:hypothetical protein HN51_055342, partial [Arachis hypogaea]
MIPSFCPCAPSSFLSASSHSPPTLLFAISVIMMRKGEVQLHARKLRSLVDLCVQKIIDNIRYLGNVGCVDLHLLEQILPHYTVDQLMRVEKGKRSKFSFSFLSTMLVCIGRDEVSEGQFSQVLIHEMDATRQVWLAEEIF